MSTRWVLPIGRLVVVFVAVDVAVAVADTNIRRALSG